MPFILHKEASHPGRSSGHLSLLVEMLKDPPQKGQKLCCNLGPSWWAGTGNLAVLQMSRASERAVAVEPCNGPRWPGSACLRPHWCLGPLLAGV